ncbi:MAG TPA: translation initiation factor IF-3 [Candidatus Limnocylindrales bacterium]|nr:translation initiation factor IF-3 [Candidatus Limnocylindrales bacterium]
MNQMIRIPTVRVVDENGSQLGVMPTAQALSMAQERGYDLVEVAPMASPPVTRFLDFGQYKYELAKREKEAKRRSRSVEFKEVRLRPKIGVGDFETKVHRAMEFLGDGDRIKVTVQFRGRELTHPEIGRNLLNRFAEAIKDDGSVDRAPLLEGRAMSMTVTSTHKPKVHEATGKARDDEAAGESQRPAGTPDGATPPTDTAPTATAPTATAPTATAPTETAPSDTAPTKSKPREQPKPSEPKVEPTAATTAPVGRPDGETGRTVEPTPEPATAGD